MNISEHRRALVDSLEEIRDAIQAGIERKQRTIGVNCSLAAISGTIPPYLACLATELASTLTITFVPFSTTATPVSSQVDSIPNIFISETC